MLNEIFDLFASLDATDEQLDFPIVYGSGRDGWMADDPKGPRGDLTPLFQRIVDHVPAPVLDETGPFTFLATLLDRDNFMGGADAVAYGLIDSVLDKRAAAP